MHIEISAVERIGVVSFLVTGRIEGGLVQFERGIIAGGTMQVKTTVTSHKGIMYTRIDNVIRIRYDQRDERFERACFFGDWIGELPIIEKKPYDTPFLGASLS